ncbi:MAG: hypothetical protein IPL65_09220 [Lewinellaceae bacterium]|nr:hypothetical protein [Lewinellaceae bacterium]
MKKIWTLLLGSLLFQITASAQTAASFPDIGIGQWQQHLPWQRAFYVTQSDAKVYFATEWAVVEIDKADRSPNFLTKVEGLSDAGMGLIRFNNNINRLLLTYSNSNIDIWNPATSSSLNMPIIVKNLNLTGDKRIYNAFLKINTLIWPAASGW